MNADAQPGMKLKQLSLLSQPADLATSFAIGVYRSHHALLQLRQTRLSQEDSSGACARSSAKSVPCPNWMCTRRMWLPFLHGLICRLGLWLEVAHAIDHL